MSTPILIIRLCGGRKARTRAGSALRLDPGPGAHRLWHAADRPFRLFRGWSTRQEQSKHYDTVLALDPHGLVGVARHRHPGTVAIRNQDGSQPFGSQHEDAHGSQLAVDDFHRSIRGMTPHS